MRTVVIPQHFTLANVKRLHSSAGGLTKGKRRKLSQSLFHDEPTLTPDDFTRQWQTCRERVRVERFEADPRRQNTN